MVKSDIPRREGALEIALDALRSGSTVYQDSTSRVVVPPLLGRDTRTLYMDEPLEKLTFRYPVAQTLGLLDVLLRRKALVPHYGLHVFGNSPARAVEIEILFGELVQSAASVGRWVGYETQWTPQDLATFYQRRTGVKTRGVGLGLTPLEEGLSNALDAGFISFRASDNKVSLAPTEGLVKYVSQRLQELSQLR